MEILPLQTLSQQCSEIFTQKPAETTVPIFFRILKDSIVAEQRPSLLLRFWRFITFRSGQYRLANCATKLQTLFTDTTLEIKDQTGLHNTLLLISATKETIRRYEAKRKALPESVKLLKKSVHNLTKELFTSLHASTRSEEKKMLYQWAEGQIKEAVKPEDTLNIVSRVSKQLFAPIEENNRALSMEIQKDIVLSLLEQEEKEALTKQYNELLAVENWDKNQPLESLIDEKISHFNEHLKRAVKTVRERFFAKVVQKKNLRARSEYVGLSTEFKEICKQEKKACERSFSIVTFRKTIKETLTKFENRIREAEREKIDKLEIAKYPLQKRLAELAGKGDKNAQMLSERLRQPSNPASMAKIVDEVSASLSLLEKERLSSFIERGVQELKLRERCYDLEQRESAQALTQELNKIQENITFQDTEESITNKLQLFHRNLKSAEKEWYNEIIAKVFLKYPEEAKKFVEKNLRIMTTALKNTNTTQNKTSYELSLKVRYREGRPQALLFKSIGTGRFKWVRVVANLLGPKIDKAPEFVYAYGKPKAPKQLATLEKELENRNLPEQIRSEKEKEKEDLLEEIESIAQEVFAEVQVSQNLPKDIAVQMYTINHQKRPEEPKGILMDWFSYGDLLNYLKNELPKLPIEKQYPAKLEIAQKMCARFAKMHKLKQCHLDIKLGQIFANKSKNGMATLRIGDFGSAQPSGTTFSGPLNTTPIFTAPELLMDTEHRVSPAMDCWSLGMCFVYIFYGQSFNRLYTPQVAVIAKNWGECQSEANHQLWLKGCQETIKGLPETAETPIIRGLLDPNPDTRSTAKQAEQAFTQLLSTL